MAFSDLVEPTVWPKNSYNDFQTLARALAIAVDVDIIAREHAKNIIKHHLKILGLDAPQFKGGEK